MVHIVKTSKWHRPSPDPQGIAYQRSTGSFVVPDSEVEETVDGVTHWKGVNVWLTTTRGKVKHSWSTTAWSDEPTDVAIHAKKTLFFSDDNQDMIFKVRTGPDRTWGTRDDRVSSFGTRAFGSHDPSGLAFGDGFLFVSDGKSNRVYQIDPGRDGRFDGVAPVGDDVVTSFDTRPLRLRDPEGIGFDRATGYLYLPNRHGKVIIRVTLDGHLVDSIDVSSLGIVSPTGIAFAPGSDDPSATHVYVTDRGIDNNMDPNENDGRIFELALNESSSG